MIGNSIWDCVQSILQRLKASSLYIQLYYANNWETTIIVKSFIIMHLLRHKLFLLQFYVLIMQCVM